MSWAGPRGLHATTSFVPSLGYTGRVTVPPGTVVGADYRIVSPLARGGMGEVYAAEQLSTGKQRAIKLMKPELLSDAALVARFEQEARVASRIQSEHVVEVLGAGVDRALGMPWLAMELLSGESLAQRLARQGRLPPTEVALVFSQLGHGLAAAHRAGIVHRDLKPENIFLARTQQVGAELKVKILDFGIAKLFGDTKTSHTGMMSLGTPRYMAPEQTGGQPITPATDVWALGLIAFQALTGKLFWKHAGGAATDSVMTLMREVLFEPLVPASRRALELGVAEWLPSGFDGWFARCVAREPNERFSEAGAAVASLHQVLVGHSGVATVVSHTPSPIGAASVPLPPAPPAARAKSKGAGAWIGLLAAVLVVGGGAFAYTQLAGESKAKKSKRDRDDDDAPKKRRRPEPEPEPTQSVTPEPPKSAVPKLPQPPVPSPVARVGTFKIALGTNPGKPGQYIGTVNFARMGSGHRVVWSTGFVGTSIESGNLVVAAWGPGPHGPAIYLVEGGKLAGSYLDGDTGTLNTQVLEGPTGLNGDYAIVASSEGDTGTISIRPNGSAYSLTATLPNQSLKGTGVLRGDKLAVGWSLATATGGGVVAYQVDGERLNGVWTFHHSPDLGVENLVRP